MRNALIAAFAILHVFGTSAFAQDDSAAKPEAASKPVLVGGAAMDTKRNIIENLVGSRDHDALLRAIKAADLVDTLAGNGPLTFFAPSDSAFDRLPRKIIEGLTGNNNRASLSKLIKLHIVAERLTTADLTDGRKLTTLAGDELTVKTRGSRVSLEDGKGNTATITTPDALQSNGIMHVIGSVLTPAS